MAAEHLTVSARCAVITGAASGIGRAMALAACKRGMDLALCDVNEAGLAATVEMLPRSGRRVLTAVVDVRSPEAVQGFAADIFERMDSVAMVFANAGVLRIMDDLRPDLLAWNEVIDVNLRGAVHMVHGFLGRLLDQAQPAQFVITGSQASFSVGPQISPYVATKHAVWGLAETLRQQLLSKQSAVGVSLLAPGRVQSAITDATKERLRTSSGEAAVAAYERLLITPDEAAEMAVGRAVKREFWILPSGERFPQSVRIRLEELLAAEHTGLLRPVD